MHSYIDLFRFNLILVRKSSPSANLSLFVFVLPKASEENVPYAPEIYRPPAELYPYLTTVGEIHEGEWSGLDQTAD